MPRSTMQQFSIKQLEQLSGIKAHTIRIWEKRYKIITPQRSDGQHRLYSNEDLKSILRIVYLYNKGLKISKIARLKEQELLQKIDLDKGEMNRWETIMPGLMEACIDLDAERINYILSEVESANGMEQMILKLVYPFLEKLGKAWVTGKIQPNNEHFVSHIISSRIILATDQLIKPKPEHGGPVIALFQPKGELHEIPLLFINYLLQKRGCKTVYFGCNVSMEAIAEFCTAKRVTHIHYHQIVNLGDTDPQKYLNEMARRFAEIRIVASGPVNKCVKATSSNVQLLKSQEEIMMYVNQVNYDRDLH